MKITSRHQIEPLSEIQRIRKQCKINGICKFEHLSSIHRVQPSHRVPSPKPTPYQKVLNNQTQAPQKLLKIIQIPQLAPF